MTPEGASSDSELVAAYGCKYIFAHVADGPRFKPFKRVSGSPPARPVGTGGEPVGGHVFIAYIVTRTGGVADAVVMNASDPRLATSALAALKHWRFRPATYLKRPVASLAVQEFGFQRP